MDTKKKTNKKQTKKPKKTPQNLHVKKIFFLLPQI